LRADAELVHRHGKLFLQLRAFGILAPAAERPAGGGNLGEMHAKIGRTTDPDTDNRRWTGLARRGERAVDHERLDGRRTFRRQRHLEERVVLRSALDI
jgi:hypothetical protein